MPLVQVLSLAGAAVLLVGYAGLQRGVLSREGWVFNALNLAGSLLLFYVALVDDRWGFIVLEGVWALLSVPALVRGLRR